MIKVITYGTFDLLHDGHINILRRARDLGDYLIVGVTGDEYDRYRGKLNVRQSVAERIAAVRDTGFADKIIIEDYEGQKIEDILKYNIDIITLGSDWTGRIDYLKQYCKVRYLPRTENISSTLLRTKGKIYNLGLICDHSLDEENIDEIKYVSGIDVNCVYTAADSVSEEVCRKRSITNASGDKEIFVAHSDIVHIDSCDENIFELIQYTIDAGKHIVAPHTCGLSAMELKELFLLAEQRKVCFLIASSLHSLTAYKKLINTALSGPLGNIYGLELSITHPRAPSSALPLVLRLAPVCLLPIIQLFGRSISGHALCIHGDASSGILARCNLETDRGYAEFKVSRDIATEGSCVIWGNKAYIKVPAPWWEMDYFEIRYGTGKIKKFSWPMCGSPLRYQLAEFIQALSENRRFATTMGQTIFFTEMAQNLYQKIN
jgi:glycerol-3-phosphate cytidylyltransferase